MISRTFESSWNVAWRTGVVVPSACATAGAYLAYLAIGAERGFFALSPAAMWFVGAVAVARFWLGLSISATALELLRAKGQWRPFRFVTMSVALQAGVVGAVLALPVLAAALFLIVPGVILAIRWSQTAMLIVDGQKSWFSAAEDSAHLVNGRRLEILSIWLIVAGVMVVVAWLQDAAVGLSAAVSLPGAVLHVVTLLVKIPVDAFSLVLVAATYYELDLEASVAAAPLRPPMPRAKMDVDETVTWQ